MSEVIDRGMTVFLPAPLLRIGAAAVVVLIGCYFVSGLHEQALAPEDATSAAVTARIQPVVVGGAKIAPQVIVAMQPAEF